MMGVGGFDCVKTLRVDPIKKIGEYFIHIVVS
jgi:hypothetical protein